MTRFAYLTILGSIEEGNAREMLLSLCQAQMACRGNKGTSALALAAPFSDAPLISEHFDGGQFAEKLSGDIFAARHMKSPCIITEGSI